MESRLIKYVEGNIYIIRVVPLIGYVGCVTCSIV